MRWVVLVIAAGCGASMHDAPVDEPDPPFDPAFAAFDSFCAADAPPVDRIDRVSVCHDSSQQRYTSTTRRRAGGWWSARGVELDPDESAHLDADVAAGIRALCAGRDDPHLDYPTLHREELGWPMSRCLASPELVLYRGDDSIVLPRPVAPELADAYWIVGVHDFGMRAVFDGTGDDD